MRYIMFIKQSFKHKKKILKKKKEKKKQGKY